MTGLVADLIRGRPSADGVYAIGDPGGRRSGTAMTGAGGDQVRVRPPPLPARGDPGPGGTNFAVSSGVAEGMLLCLFDDAGAETRVVLPEYDAGVWHGLVEWVGAGQAYGYRATGPWDPARALQPSQAAARPLRAATIGPVRFGPEVLRRRRS